MIYGESSPMIATTQEAIMPIAFGSRNRGPAPFRFVHVGVAAALAAATVAAIGVVQDAGAAGSIASSYVPIVPCRLADTRSGADHVGARASALGAAEVVAFAVWGTNGNCTIPNTATGIATNVTAVNPSATSYLTLYPSDASPRPTASNLNFVAGSPPTPNQVTVALSAAGAISAFNNGGTVDVIIDIVGYYLPAGVGTQGPPGPPGPPGPAGTAAGGSITFTGQNATFNGDAASVDLASGCATLKAAGTGKLFVPLTIPNGATIVAVRVRSSDAAGGGQANYKLYEANPGIGEGEMASFNSTDGVNITPMTFGPLIAVSEVNTFYLFAQIVNSASEQKLCSVTVDYTM